MTTGIWAANMKSTNPGELIYQDLRVLTSSSIPNCERNNPCFHLQNTRGAGKNLILMSGAHFGD